MTPKEFSARKRLIDRKYKLERKKLEAERVMRQRTESPALLITNQLVAGWGGVDDHTFRLAELDKREAQEHLDLIAEYAKPPESQPTEIPKRMPSSITSLAAVKRMDAFRAKKHWNLTEFATQAQTTERTIRKFRKTYSIRRSILEGIAKAMNMTIEELTSE
jgi:DNA-binding Xre family transcriptional regulator